MRSVVQPHLNTDMFIHVPNVWTQKQGENIFSLSSWDQKWWKQLDEELKKEESWIGYYKSFILFQHRTSG